MLVGRWARAARASSACASWVKWRRLNRPVSMSCCARYCNSALRALNWRCNRVAFTYCCHTVHDATADITGTDMLSNRTPSSCTASSPSRLSE